MQSIPAPADTVWNGYSLAERDRRWAAVRKFAADAGLDCVFVPQCVDGRNLHLSLEQVRGTRSDCRYLTQMENAAVVLPSDGRPPIVVNDRGTSNEWIPDARPAVRGGDRASWGPAMAQALLDAGMERARIGVVGLGRGKVTHGRAFAGVVNHSSYEEVRRRLPSATFEDATDVVGYARYVKGDEEVEALRRGAAIANAGIQEMVDAARVGTPQATLYARVMRRMLELGSEYYPLAIYFNRLGGRSWRFEDPPPLEQKIEPNMVITNETDAVWGGLVAQEVQPIITGAIPDAHKPVIELHRDLFQAGLEYMTPGREFADLIDYINGFGAKRGMKTAILMHGRGCGDDGPLLTPQDQGDRIRDVRVEKNNVWVWKPQAFSADGRTSFSCGGCVVVTEKGGVRLVDRPHGMVEVK